MKKTFLLLAICLLSLSGIAQKKYSADDVKQFYRTIQGGYKGQINDSTTLSLYFTPIWEYDSFKWFYMEAFNDSTKETIEQKIIEIQPVNDISFKVIVHGIAHPERFAGKWSNPNFFDGFNTGILKGTGKFSFMKTMDFEYQTSWSGRKNLKCFPSGDRVHFKFVQEDERLYVKRLLSGTSTLIGITFYKRPTE